MEEIKRGVEVNIQYMDRQRRGVVMVESTATPNGRSGKFWWVKVYGAKNLHLCRNENDIEIVKGAPT